MKTLCTILGGLIGLATPTAIIASQIDFTKENAVYYEISLTVGVFTALVASHYGSKIPKH